MPRLATRLAWFALGVAIGAPLAVRWITRRASLITPPVFAPLLLSRVRMAYRCPEDVVVFAGVKPDWTVLDLGCGNGAFTLTLAARARCVHAVDVQPTMIEALTRRLHASRVTNVVPRIAPAAHLPFGDATFDAVVVISILPMLHERDAALAEVWRVVKPAGVLIVGEELIEPEYVTRRVTHRWVEVAGFRLVASQVNLLRYTLKFAKIDDDGGVN